MPSAAAERLRTRRTTWRPSHRLVPSRFPPTGLFDRVADPADLDAVFALEAMTNDRLREEAGDLRLVPPSERITGPGTSPIMAAFTHLNPEGSRFSDGSFGVYYCAHELDTALAEVRYHREIFMRRTREGPMRLDLRLYLADLDARLVDVRHQPECHRPDDNAGSRALGADSRRAGRDGILYRSVRHPGGTCAAVLRPAVLRNCRQSGHYTFHYDGNRIVAIDALATVWTAGDAAVDGGPRREPDPTD
ncbi:MAG: RES family NAD+ phosphorylase [Casimicrobiaceae bacterium]